MLGLPVVRRVEGPAQVPGDVELGQHRLIVLLLRLNLHDADVINNLLEQRLIVLNVIRTTSQLDPEPTWLSL